MKIRKLISVSALIFTLLFILGCVQSEVQHNMETDIAAIQEIGKQGMRAYSAQDLSTLETLFTDDLILMPPDRPIIIGKEAMLEWVENVFLVFEPGGYTTASNVIVAGDWAIEHYTFNLAMRPKDGGEAIQEKGKGLHIYRRQADGSWKIARDIWNCDEPVKRVQQALDKSS